MGSDSGNNTNNAINDGNDDSLLIHQPKKKSQGLVKSCNIFLETFTPFHTIELSNSYLENNININ
jgi:hypothetical protein